MDTRKRQRKAGDDKSTIIARAPEATRDERAAVEFWEDLRWGSDPFCPKCGAFDVSQMKGRDGNRNKRFLWTCHACREQFTVRMGSVMEDSRIPYRVWCHALWRSCASKKGVSALQIKRETGLSYKSALFLMHRIRWAMTGSTGGMLDGFVEADETYVGGKPRLGQRRFISDKKPVFAVVKRGGNVRAFPITRVTSENLGRALVNHVHPASVLMTDELPAYRKPGKEFKGGHYTVNHFRGEYVRGDGRFTTNTVEGFFALIKRGLMGTFHAVSERHLHRYVTEFEFRYNWRKVDDGERMRQAVKGAEGKRLRYKRPR